MNEDLNGCQYETDGLWEHKVFAEFESKTNSWPVPNAARPGI